MSIASPEVFDELVRSGVRGRLTVVVGAGASRDAGLPDWVELVRRVVGAAVDQARARGDAAVIDDLGPPEDLGRRPEVDRLRMTLAQQVLGKERYYETLASIFEVAGTPTSTHKALARLPGTTFLTTNYDRLLEAAILEASGRSPTVVLPDDLEGLASLDQGHILKLHGDIGRPESVVLTQGGYQRVRYELGPGWKKVVESLLRPPGLILLMGFSYSDPDVEEVVSGFQAAFGGVGKPIWLERDAPLARAKAEDLGLRLAAVTNFAELPGWIEELGDAIRRGQREGAWTLVVDDLAPQLGAAQASHQRWLDEAKAAWDAGTGREPRTCTAPSSRTSRQLRRPSPLQTGCAGCSPERASAPPRARQTCRTRNGRSPTSSR